MVVGNRFVEVAQLQVNEAAAVKCIRIIWPQPQRLIAIGQRLFELLLCPGQDRTRPAAVVARVRVIGLTLESLIAILDSAAIIGLINKHRATAQIGINVVGIEPDCLVIVGHRLVVVVLLSENIAAAHEEVGLFRIKSDRMIAVPYRLVMFALGVVGKTAIVEGNSIVGLQLDGFIVVLDRLIVSAQAEKNVSPVVECSGILWIESDRLVVILRRGVVIALVDICVAPNDVGDGQISGLVFPRGDRGSASGDRTKSSAAAAASLPDAATNITATRRARGSCIALKVGPHKIRHTAVHMLPPFEVEDLTAFEVIPCPSAIVSR